MDASLPGGCSAQEVEQVPLQVEAVGGSTEVGNNITGKQSSLGFFKLHTTGVAPIVEPTKNADADGNFKMPIHVSRGIINEDSRLVSSNVLGSSTVVSPFQNSHPGEHEIWKKGNGLSVKKSTRENGAQKEEEARSGHKGVAKDAPQVRTESQLPMRQLARKGGLLKGEAVSTPKTVLSVADAVKEGILKKERQEQDRKDALEAVMAVHGRTKEVTGHAALFPGVTGPESGRLCQCCSRLESLKSTIFCDKCERGFHVDCVKHWPKPAQELDVWHCGPCGLQPGHYWPLGRVLISYDDAVAEYQKYSSSFLTSLQQKEESGFGGAFPLGLDPKTHEKSNGLEGGGATKVKVIRDFKKEARKGTGKGCVAITANESGHAAPMHVKESGTMTGIQAQPNTLSYPGYVPIQPKSALNSIAPIVNFIVPPESSVITTLPSPKAHVPAHSTSTKLLYTTSKDSTGPRALSVSQYQNTSVMNQYVASPVPIVTGPSNLSSGTKQISFQQKIPQTASGTIGLEVSSIEELRPFVVGERFTEREELLKEAKESLKQLRTFISGLQGTLPEDWRVILRRRPTGAQEKFYLSPAKRKYRSRQDVARFLGLVRDPRIGRTKSNNFETTSVDRLLVDKNDISPPAIQAIEVRTLPMFCGDVMIEKLGVIDSRPTYSNELHIWPVGFRSSWHDPETGSYCISGVVDGGDLGPIFRVTRKLVIGPANNNDDLLATSSLGKSALVGGGSTGEAGKFKASEEKSSPVKSALGGAKIGDSSVYKLPAEGNKGDAQKQHEGHKEPDNQKDGTIIIGKGHEDENKTMSSDALSKNHVVTNLSVGNQAVIDLTEEKEISETTLKIEVSVLDVKSDSTNTISAGKDVGALENVIAENHHTELPPVVIDLSDEEDDKPSALVSRDKGPGPGVGDPGPIKALGLLSPPVKPLPNILVEEFTVEARTPGEAWRLFSKQFVENCKTSLRSRTNCTVPILEATNDYVIYHSGTSNLGDGIANSALLRQESIDRRETTKALFYEKLEKRLGEDRFGLNLPEVQKMIKALHTGKPALPAGNAKAWVKGIDQIVEAARTTASLAPSFNDEGSWKRRKRKSKADVAAEECAKKIKPSSLEPVAHQHLLNLGVGEQRGIENVVFRNSAPAVVVPVPAPASVAMGSVPSYTPTTTTAAPVPPPVIVIEKPRLPPPAGQPVLKRLPSELVGDLLQVWEFLSRFSDLFGHDLHCTLEDLEAGLMDVALARAGLEGVTTEIKDSSIKHSGEKENVGAVVGLGLQSVTAGSGEPRNVTDLDESGDKDPTKGNKLSDIRQENLEVRDLEQDKDLKAAGEMQSGVITSSPSPCIEDAERKENASGDLKCQGNESNASQRGQSETKNSTVVFSDGGLDKGLAFLAEAHIPLLKFLVADLKFRVSRSLNEDDGDEPKKRGRKRLCDIGALPPELGDDLPMNAISWPELAHRYLVAILDMKKQGEITELAPEERKKLVRYFEGDGGVMGGAVEGVVGVESDAQVLAEAEKELTLRMPKTIEKDIVIFVPQQWDVALTPINPAPKKIKSGKTGELPEDLPKWVEALEPVRKMPTNLGTKLKNQVQVSLDLNPPDWAKATLEWSLSKGTFKSNAAGTTKRACLEVLAQYHGEELKAINAPRVRKVKAAPSAEHLMQRCRIVLREVAKADSKQVFSNLVGGAFAVRSSKDAADTLARPLDFRTIDARLAAGAYGGSTDAFAADMRQVWKNVEEVHKSGSAILELASSLSQLFEKLYLKQVISLIKGVSETRDREKEDGSGKKPSNKPGTKVTDDKLGKAPWEDDTTCRVCGIDEDYDSILLCDGCDAEYHIYCLVPPLEKVPKGNWFCPSCVAVEEGFPEVPSLGEAELAALQEEMERPVAGSILKLEYEDEKMSTGKKTEPEKTTVRMLRSRTKSELEMEDETTLLEESQPLAVESNVEALLRELEEKEYWQLSISDKLFLLKFLCAEALKTPQVRAHLEKSVEVSLELQQHLRDLVAERLKIVIPMDASTNRAKPADIETLQKTQTKAAKIASPVPSGDDDVVLLGDSSMSEMKTQESVVGLDLDLNVVAGKEPESDHLPPDHKVSSGTSPVETNKERPLVKDLDNKIPHQSSLNEKLGPEQDPNFGKSKSSHIHVTNVSEGVQGVEGDISIQADAAAKPLNPLKRSFETATLDLPTKLTNGSEKKAKEEGTAVKSTPSGVNGAESNDVTTMSSDGQTTIAGNVQEDKDVRLVALQRARDLDVRITKLGAKLFNLSLRREHMGTDHLGREYWALTGIDGKPCLVVADMTSSGSQDQSGKGTNLNPGNQMEGFHQGTEESKTPSEEKRNDAPDMKTVQEGIKWLYYKGDKALDELVKWLSPRDQQERVLRISIYHWRRSLSSRHVLDMSEITTAASDAAGASTTTEPTSKVVDESGALREEKTEEIRNFPSVKATKLLLKRYAAPNAVMSDENAPSKKDNLFQRCECLELLWTSRHHCQACHETYESTTEFQTHLNDCPPGSKAKPKPNPENVLKESQPQIPPKAKKTKKLSSFDTTPDLPQTTAKAGSATRSERARRGLKRGGSQQPAVDDDVDMEPVESMELLSEYVESLRTPEAQVPVVEHTPSNGLLKTLEELIEQPPSPKVLSQPSEQPMETTAQEPRGENDTFATNFSVDDCKWDSNTLPAKFGVGSGKQVVDATNESQKPEGLNCSNNLQSGQGNTGGWVDDLKISNESVRGQDQLNCSTGNNPQGGQENSGGWVNDLNISDQQFRDQELYSHQANCSSINGQNGQGNNNGGWVNDLNISNSSFTDQVLSNCSNTAHGNNHGNSGGWANDLNVASSQSFREDPAPASSFGYHHPPAPSMISTTQSDRGRSFAPAVQQNPLVFDSSLMIPSSPDYPSMEGFPSLESTNPAASQYQQLVIPPPVANTNFLLSLSDPTNPKPVPYNQYLPPLDHANNPQQLSFQQMLSSHDTLNASSSLYPNFLPGPENVNITTPLSYSNPLHSLDSSRNSQPVLYNSQYNSSLENINLNTGKNSPASSFPNLNYTNSPAVPYVNLSSNFSHPNLNNTHSNNPPLYSTNLNSNARLNLQSSPLFANFSNTNTNPSDPHHNTGVNANSNPSLCTSLNVSNLPPPQSYAHVGEPEIKRFVGRFNSNAWFDSSRSSGEPLTLERPAVMPTKPTARRTSTWDYLINLPLPSSQGNERSVQRHSSPPPIEAGSLPFDLMFEKPQREDLNTSSSAPEEENGAPLTLDPMFEGQQQQIDNNSTGDAVSMRADSVTLDLMLEKHEQEQGALPEAATDPNEVGSLSIDLMSLPEEHIEIMGTAEEETCMQCEPIETAKEIPSGDVLGDRTEAATGVCEDNVQVDCSEVAKESCQAGKDACVEDVQVEAQQEEVEVDRVAEAKQGELVASSERRTSLPPRVPVATNASGTGRKPVKRFPVVNASVCTLVGEQKKFLKRLQISLLDMEAALATDVLESSRALPVRRRAWRAFVKAASCIYEVTKAIILLELMVKAECLKPYWGFWSSLSAAARSSSLSSLALRLFALDGAITYERVKAPEDEKENTINPSKNLKSKKKKPLELPLPPPAKKKKKK